MAAMLMSTPPAFFTPDSSDLHPLDFTLSSATTQSRRPSTPSRPTSPPAGLPSTSTSPVSPTKTLAAQQQRSRDGSHTQEQIVERLSAAETLVVQRQGVAGGEQAVEVLIHHEPDDLQVEVNSNSQGPRAQQSNDVEVVTLCDAHYAGHILARPPVRKASLASVSLEQLLHVQVSAPPPETDSDLSASSSLVAPPVLLSHNGTTYSLFSSKSPPAEGPSDPESPDSPFPLLFGDLSSLYYSPIESFLDSLHSTFPELNSKQEELVLSFEAIGISLPEDNIYTREVSLYDFDRIHVGCGLAGRLQVTLESQARFSTGFNALAEHIANSFSISTTDEEDPAPGIDENDPEGFESLPEPTVEILDDEDDPTLLVDYDRDDDENTLIEEEHEEDEAQPPGEILDDEDDPALVVDCDGDDGANTLIEEAYGEVQEEVQAWGESEQVGGEEEYEGVDEEDLAELEETVALEETADEETFGGEDDPLPIEEEGDAGTEEEVPAEFEAEEANFDPAPVVDSSILQDPEGAPTQSTEPLEPAPQEDSLDALPAEDPSAALPEYEPLELDAVPTGIPSAVAQSDEATELDLLAEDDVVIDYEETFEESISAVSPSAVASPSAVSEPAPQSPVSKRSRDEFDLDVEDEGILAEPSSAGDAKRPRISSAQQSSVAG